MAPSNGESGSSRKPVVVIGAGIVGVSAAIWLQRVGFDVVIIDRAGPGEGTSYGNGGVLAACSIVPVTVPGLLAKAPRMLFDPRQPLFLKWRYLPTLVPWLGQYLRHCTAEEVERIAGALTPLIGQSLADHQALAKDTGAQQRIVPADYLFVYRTRADFERDRFAWSVRRDHGFRWQELDAAALHDLEPIYGPALAFAARVGGHGRIDDPGQYVKDLASHVCRRGGRLLRANVSDIVRDNGRVTGVVADGENIACSAVVLAAGAWSARLTQRLGLRVPLESERGYHLELWHPNTMPKAPAMIAAGKFVVTPMTDRVRLAGIVEFGGLRASRSRAPLELLKRSIGTALPGLTWDKTDEWMGHRPVLADSLPAIGELPRVKGAFLGFGHHHVGITGGAKTGRLLAQLVAGKTPDIDVTPYAPGRFQ